MSKDTYAKIKNTCISDIFIWGDGAFAALLEKELREHGIPVAGHVVDDEFAKNSGAMSRSELLGRRRPYAIIRGFYEAFALQKEEVMRHWPGCTAEFMIANLIDYDPETVIEPLDPEFYFRHKTEFEEVRQNLADSLSKHTLDAWIDAKLTGSLDAGRNLIDPNQYFGFHAPWRYRDDEILLDCGAYDGDTVASFLYHCAGKYKKIVAFEPDKQNFAKLSKFVEENAIERIALYPLGVYDRRATLSFSAVGESSSAIESEGNTVVEVDSIDRILGGAPATIIKMDIEGSERNALAGARQTVGKYRPILMICAYHKKDDIFAIYQQIRSYVSGYRYYLRWHRYYTCELVLYAVPEERIERNG